MKITSTPDTNNYLVAYQGGAASDPPVTNETYPAGVEHRAAIIWGFVKKGTVTADLIFDYSGIPGITDPSALRLIKRSSIHSPWKDITDQFTNDTGNLRFVGSGISEFSEFTIGGSGGNALPVQLVSFAAVSEGMNAVLRWTTATETACYGFEIERRKAESRAWTRVGFVPGAGTASSLSTYEFTDEVGTPGRYAYRIKQIDTDGSYRYAMAVEVEIAAVPDKLALDQNYPNPFNPSTVIRYQLPAQSHVSMKVYDATGRQVAVLVNEEKQPGFYSLTWDASALPSGVYFCHLEVASVSNPDGQFGDTKKMILLR